MATVRYFAAAAEAAGTESEQVHADDLGSLLDRDPSQQGGVDGAFGCEDPQVGQVRQPARRDVLGGFRNRVWTTAAGIAASLFLITLNGVLLWLVFTGG